MTSIRRHRRAGILWEEIALAQFFIIFFSVSALPDSSSFSISYPPSSGIYSRIIVTGRTVLARDGGNVGIGTSNPQYPLDIGASVAASPPVPLEYVNFPPPQNPFKYCDQPGCNSGFYSLRTQGRINVIGAVDVTSDERLKILLSRLDPAKSLDCVNGLRPLRFRWKPSTHQGSRNVAGFFAQEVAKKIPEAVTVLKKGAYLSNEYQMNYDALLAYAVSAIQALKKDNAKARALLAQEDARIQERQTQIKDMENRIRHLQGELKLSGE